MSETASSGRGRIVVGVDGSAGSGHALRWAARQAELTGAALEIIIGWQYPAFFGWAPAGPDQVDFAKIAGETLSAAVSEVFGPEPPGWVSTRVIEGYPARVLVDASAGADLLVVGSRGHGGFADVLLGSVSTFCVHHAHSPVTVIRPVS
jgi:nucleotide-binding universal stress UspA family protein